MGREIPGCLSPLGGYPLGRCAGADSAVARNPVHVGRIGSRCRFIPVSSVIGVKPGGVQPIPNGERSSHLTVEFVEQGLIIADGVDVIAQIEEEMGP